MKAFSRLLAATSLLAVAGCSTLPEANFGQTFSVGPFLKHQIVGDGFNAALAREYQAMAEWTATRDVNWYNATAYQSRAQAALAGQAIGPWDPASLGLGGETLALYQRVASTVAANRDRHPQACARAQALFDKYLEELSQGDHACSDPNEIRALLEEALNACGYTPAVAPPPPPQPIPPPPPQPQPPVYVPAPAPAPAPVPPPVYVPAPAPAPVPPPVYVPAPAPAPVPPPPVYVPAPAPAPAPQPPVYEAPPVVQQPTYPTLYTIYFGFDRSDLTAEANQVVSEIVTAFRAFGNPFLNVIGHADTSGSKAYNQRLAERRAQTVGSALEAQGVPRSNLRVSASGELAPAVPTGDSVRQAENRRVTVEIVR